MKLIAIAIVVYVLGFVLMAFFQASFTPLQAMALQHGRDPFTTRQHLLLVGIFVCKWIGGGLVLAGIVMLLWGA
jgi:hypothetical protein